MYAHSFLWHYLWLGPHLLQLVVAVVMSRRNLTREFPWFFAYCLIEGTQGTLLFTFDHMDSVSAYQWRIMLWIFRGVCIFLRFGIIYEVFTHLFRRYPGLEQLSKFLFQCALVVLLLMAVAITVHSPGAEGPRIVTALFVVDRAVSFIQGGLLLFLFVFASIFGLSWSDYTFGIAVGFGLYSTVVLATSALDAQMGEGAGGTLLDMAVMGAFQCAVLIWLCYLWAPESSRESVRTVPHVELEKWNAELQRVLFR
jgi:hypothetical protein